MYSRFAFALLFSVCAFGLGIAIPAFPVDETKCGPNAEYLRCGSACVSDCSHPEPYEICTYQCVMGCFCKPGFLKNANGECVRPEQCDAKTHHDIPMAMPTMPKCPENEEFHPCGTACPATCANPKPSPVCTRNCVIGCFCKPGFLRNSQGVCVPADNCEAAQPAMFFAYPPEVSQCKENEVFMPCGSACAPTCAQPHPTICTLQCVIGCFCKPGYLKNEQGVCVPSEQCGVPAAEAMPLPPAMCGDNEEYRQCKGCDGTCAKPNPICPRICVPGCACKQGHLRDGNGRCMLKEQCPHVEAMPMAPAMCGENEEFRQCKGCDGSCANPNPACPRICIPGCACKQGHLRDGNGRCMPKEQCPHVQAASFMLLPPNKCGENEVFHTCGTACPATCANPHPSPVCTKNCVIGCFCKEGFLKNDQGKCVAAANCAPIAMMTSETVHKCPTDREAYINDPVAAELDCLASCDTPMPFLIHGEPQIPKKCQQVERKAACVCMKPFVRNSHGLCVHREECHRDKPFVTLAPEH